MIKYRGVEIERDETGYFFNGLFSAQGFFDTLDEAKEAVDIEIIEDQQNDPSYPPDDTPSIDLMAHHGPWHG